MTNAASTSFTKEKPHFIYQWSWLFFCLVLFATNSHISPDSHLTKITALDTTIYLAIADAAPSTPAPGSGLVYHGAMRFLFPYSLGLIAKALGLSSWSVFQATVHVLTLLTSAVFWKISGLLTKSLQVRVLASAVLCFYVYLFRMELAFSGYLNDGLFVFGLTLSIWSILSGRPFYLFGSLAVMAIGKQTVFFVIPALITWTCVASNWKSRSHIWKGLFWCLALIALFGHYLIIHSIVTPFSANATTSQMALGLYHWVRETPLLVAVDQFFRFFARGALGLFFPVVFLAIAIKKGTFRKMSSNQWCLLGLFLCAIAQPFLSGPAATEGSIQRLEGLGVVPLLCMALTFLPEDMSFPKSRMFFLSIGFIFVSSFHHLYSILGPNLELRNIFGIVQLVAGLLFLCLSRNLVRKNDPNGFAQT